MLIELKDAVKQYGSGDTAVYALDHASFQLEEGKICVILGPSGSGKSTMLNMLQFVNVKIYMFGVTALTGYIVAYMPAFPALLFFELVIATIGTIATTTWIGMGVLIQKFYLRHFRIINIILALTLLECIWGMLK